MSGVDDALARTPADGAAGVTPVRRLGRDDVARVAELERAVFGPSAWTEPMVAAEVEGPDRWYVGVDDVAPDGTSELVGYGGLWFDGETATVMTLAVAEHARGHGLGSALLRALVDRARGLGATAVFLEVRVDNDAAIGMYERAGFVRLGLRRRYYQPENVDALTMRLVLRGER